MTSLWHVYARALYTAQLRTLFGMVGDGVGLLEAAAAQGGFQILEAYDQRAAVGMAIGFAQATRRCAVLAASPGPGLANAAMGILEAASLQTPLLILSNGVSRRLKGTGAFQEFDTLRFMPAITKWAYRVESSHRVMWALERALHLALNGRKGPVFLELPDDLIALKTPLTDPLPSLPHALRVQLALCTS